MKITVTNDSPKFECSLDVEGSTVGDLLKDLISSFEGNITLTNKTTRADGSTDDQKMTFQFGGAELGKGSK